jgi:DNA polymerase-1
MRRLTTEQLLAEQARYQAILANGVDPEGRRLAEARLAEIDAELARRNEQLFAAQRGNRWPHVDLVALYREFGGTIARERSNGTMSGDHPWKHSSKSGTCLVLWPAEGRWFCNSCRAGGDAAALVADARGLTYAEACRWLENRFGPAPQAYDRLPWIDAGIQDVRVLASEAWRAIAAVNEPAPFLFRFGGTLVRLERDEHGTLVPVDLTADRLRYTLARCANFYKRTAHDGTDRRVVGRPPNWLVADLLATPEPPLPVLRRIVSVPVFAPDGTLVCEPGFYPATGIYYDPAPGLVVPPVSPRPTDDEVARARALLLNDLLVDFPFVSAADRAHAVGLLLLPFVRELIDGPTPLHMIEAPTEGSGKGLLAAVALLPAVGERVGLLAPGRDADEWRKSITSVLRAGHQAVLIDNITRPLDSAELAAALTATTWEDRLLGRSELLRLPVRCVWVATANNPVFSRELARRTVRIRIDPKVDMPWKRCGFKHPALVAWARQHRGELVWAALTLTQNWLARGRPAPSVPGLGSFEAWTSVVGGILASAGIDGFLDNLDEFYETVVSDVARWRAFADLWWERYRDEPVLARELVSLALEADLDVRGKDDRAQARSLGKQLERMRERVIGEYRLEHAGTDRTNAVRWRLRRVGKGPTGPTTPEPAPGLGVGSAGSAGFDGCFSLDPESCAAHSEPERANETLQTMHNLQGLSGTPVLVCDTHQLTAVLPRLLAAPVIGLDTETTGLDPFTDRLRLVQLALPDGSVYVVDCFAVDPRLLAPLFAAPDGPTLVGHNLAFDLRFLVQAGLPVPPGRRLFDTMLATQVLDATGRQPSLAEIVRRFLDRDLPKELQTADWSGSLSPAMLDYAAQDAAVLLPLFTVLTSELEAAGLLRVLELESRTLPAVVWLAHAGAPFDSDAWRAVSDAAYAEQLRLAEELDALATDLLGPNTLFGHTVNWDSAPQVLRLLQEIGLDVTDTREETLAQHREHPLVAKLVAYREAAKRAGTYGLDWLRFVHPLTGRIHGDWRQVGTASGRMACTRPNLQNIPRDSRYRACFRPGEGRVLVKADYSQIELRIAAELSGDERMLAAFARGEDLHTLTASLLLRKAPDAVTKEDRQLAKAVNFGLLYGMGPAAFADYARTAYGLTLTDAEAKTLRDRFFAAYPGLKRWHRSQPDGAVAVRTASGRRRVVERFTEKLNTPVQGSSSDVLKLALAFLWETRHQCPSAVPVLVVHDEITLECDVDEAARARDWLVDCMQRGMQQFLRRVPVAVEATICRDWAGTPVDSEERG